MVNFNGQTFCYGVSPYHLIRPEQDRLRDRDAESFRGLQIHHQLELGGLLDWQVARFGAFEDLVHVTRGTPKHRGMVNCVGKQHPLPCEGFVGINKRQPRFHSQLEKRFSLGCHKGVVDNQHCVHA